MPDSAIKLSIIIVNFKSKHCLKDCLNSVFEKIKPEAEIEAIIVNNDKEENLDDLKDEFEKVIFINANENRGFGSANNLGAGKAKGEILLFLNPDAEIFSQNILEIFEEFDKDENLAIIGSGLLDENGKIQGWSAGKEISLGGLIKNNLGCAQDKKIWEAWKKTPVDWVAGTSLFIRRNLFKKLGGFDEKFFMYFEDMDLCKRARIEGKKIMFAPNFLVLHKGGTSYQDKKKQKKDYYDSQEYYFKKHKGAAEVFLINFLRKLFLK